MFILAQILSLLGMLSNIIALQLKTKKRILLTVVAGNLLFLMSYLLLKAYAGTIICFFNMIIIIINTLLEDKGKKTPKPLIFIYIVIACLIGYSSFNVIVDLLPILSSILLITSLIPSKEKIIRVLLVCNLTSWLIYDFCYLAYMACISDLFSISSGLIAIYRYDRKNKNFT